VIKKIIGPANWLGKDIQQATDWVHVFSTEEVDEIKTALAQMTSKGIALKD